jgi:hypothetical protein
LRDALAGWEPADEIDELTVSLRELHHDGVELETREGLYERFPDYEPQELLEALRRAPDLHRFCHLLGD